MAQFRVPCSFANQGCDWGGTVQELNRHLPTCGYAVLECTECHQQELRRHFEKHQTSLCPYRSYECNYCKEYASTYNDVQYYHWPNCELKPILCPMECGASVVRKVLWKHIERECKGKPRADLQKTLSLGNSPSEERKKDSEIQELKDRIESYEKEMGRLKLESNVFNSSDSKELQIDVDSAKKALSYEETKRSALEKKVKESEAEILKLNAVLKDLQAKHETEIEESKKLTTNKEAEIQRLTEALKDFQATHEKEIEEQKKSALAQNEESEKKLSETKKVLEENQTQSSALENDKQNAPGTPEGERLKVLENDLKKSKDRCKEWETLCLDYEARSVKEKAGAAIEKRRLEHQISLLNDAAVEQANHGANGGVQRKAAATAPGRKQLQGGLLEDPTHDIHWTRCNSLTSAIWDCSAVRIGDFVYAGGGSAKDRKECIVLKYSWQGQTWATLASAERSKFAMVSYQNELVLIGGIDEKTSMWLASVLVWDEHMHKWSNGKYPPLNEQRCNAAATAFGAYIVVAGGEGRNRNKLSTVEVYSETTKRWVFVAPLPLGVSLAKLVAFQHKLYLAGGDGMEVLSVETEQLIESQPNHKAWKRMSDITDKFARVTLVAFGGDLLAIGGVGTALASDKVRVYFPGRDVWLPLKNALPDTYYGMAPVELPSGELLLVGGCSVMGAYKHVYKGCLQVAI